MARILPPIDQPVEVLPVEEELAKLLPVAKWDADPRQDPGPLKLPHGPSGDAKVVSCLLQREQPRDGVDTGLTSPKGVQDPLVNRLFIRGFSLSGWLELGTGGWGRGGNSYVFGYVLGGGLKVPG